MFNTFDVGAGYLRKEEYYYADALADAFEKLDQKWKDALAIKSGSHNISAFSQFKAFYSGRRLVYPKTPAGLTEATDMLLMIFYDNLLLIKQIEKQSELMDKIADFDNWADVTRHGSASRAKTLSDNTSVDYSEGQEKTGTSSASLSKASDDNSYTGEETNVVPVNSLNKQTGMNIAEGTRASKSATTNASTSANEGVLASFSHSSNSAHDYINFLKLDSQKLVFKFWKKFEPMFYRT